MKKYFNKSIITCVMLFSLLSLQGLPISGPINIGSISFKDAVWDKSYNIFYSKQKVGNLTEENRAVVLYLFEICFT